MARKSPPPIAIPDSGNDSFGIEDFPQPEPDAAQKGPAGWSAETAAPTGWVTIVFCDIPDAAVLYRDLPIEMSQAVPKYLELAKGLLEEQNGYLVRCSGCALMCAFSSAIDAINWCFDVQVRLLGMLSEDDPLLQHNSSVHQPWEGQGDPSGGPGSNCVYRGLRAAMGMHCGKPYFEVDKASGTVHYYGPAVHVAAHMTSMARGGQVLLSQKAYQEVAPFCWPDDMNPISRPPVVDMLGWRELRDRDRDSFETHMEMVQVFQLLPLSLNERSFPPLPTEPRIKPHFVDMYRYEQGQKQVASKANEVRALKARCLMLLQEREQMQARINERDKVLQRYAAESNQTEKHTSDLHGELQRLRHEKEQALVEVAELRADRMLDSDKMAQHLCIKLELAEKQIREMSEKKCSLCAEPLGYEMATSTDDPRCVVICGLQQSLSLIYESALTSLFRPQKVERVLVRWSDKHLHKEGISPIAHLFFPTEEQAVEAANVAVGREVLGSGPLVVRMRAGDPRLHQWRRQNAVAKRTGASPDPIGEMSSVPSQALELSGRVQFSLPLEPTDDPDSPDELQLQLARSPVKSAISVERMQLELTLVQTQNLRMKQILGRFILLARQCVNCGARTIEKQFWGSTDPTVDDMDDQEREDIEFDALQESAALWIQQTVDALRKRNADGSPWKEPTGDLLQLLNAVRRFVMSARLLAQRRTAAGQAKERMLAREAKLAESKSNSALDRVQQALIGFFANVSGTVNVGTQAGWTDPREKGMQTERQQLVPLPPTRPRRRAPAVCKGSNWAGERGRVTPPRSPSRNAPAPSPVALAPAARPGVQDAAGAAHGYGALLSLQKQQREERVLASAAPPAGGSARRRSCNIRVPQPAESRPPPSPSPSGSQLPPIEPPAPAVLEVQTAMTAAERERWVRYLRVRATHSPMGSKWPPEAHRDHDLRTKRVSLQLPRIPAQ
eukprot:TRINITY_DN10162_c3_g1_i1.p1 TRINITY_DN10162_c3_g1~~TRINITY_DN10162_c3_g1_i1.p1  ORF type:complete len:984 (+),score=321.79 TRINITY_DN10162_c3_g1_i1:85-2952(+)